jgi:hypothetical protein
VNDIGGVVSGCGGQGAGRREEGALGSAGGPGWPISHAWYWMNRSKMFSLSFGGAFVAGAPG